MDQTERYVQLARKGREAFLADSAPAVLLRRRDRMENTKSSILGDIRVTQEEETLLAKLDGTFTSPGSTANHLVYPLAKKPGAPFADMIMIGRTTNNDIVLRDVTISRFHAFFRENDDGWVVCDAGSKNGTTLNDEPLVARKEQPVTSGDTVVLGDISTKFYTADALFEVLQADLI